MVFQTFYGLEKLLLFDIGWLWAAGNGVRVKVCEINFSHPSTMSSYVYICSWSIILCYMWFKCMQISLSRMCELWEKFVTGSSNVARELSFAAKSLLANLSSENGSFSEIVCIHNTRWFPTWDWNVRKFIPRRCRHTTSCEKYCKPPFDSSKSPSKFYERISPVSCWWREIFIDFSFHRSRSQTTITTALSIAKVQSSRFNQLYTERVVYAHSLISIM